MGRLEVRLTINRPLSTVFDVYTRGDAFQWSDLRSAQWTHGKPWEVESRMRLEPSGAFGVIIDQVLTHYEPRKRIDWISHFGGVTMTSELHLRALSEDLTEIRSDIEFVGSFSRIAGFALGPAIESGARRFYEDLKHECERTAEAIKINPAPSDALQNASRRETGRIDT